MVSVNVSQTRVPGLVQQTAYLITGTTPNSPGGSIICSNTSDYMVNPQYENVLQFLVGF